MSKQDPTPDNEIFNREAKTLSEASGIDVDSINNRMKNLFGEENPHNRVDAMEAFYNNFTHKELAVMFEEKLYREAEAENFLARLKEENE